MGMSNAANGTVRYEVVVCEIAYNGEHGYPCTYELTGAGARDRALAFARQEYIERASVTSVRVRRLGGRAPACGVLLLNVRRPYGEVLAPGQYGPFLPVDRACEHGQRALAVSRAQAHAPRSAA